MEDDKPYLDFMSATTKTLMKADRWQPDPFSHDGKVMAISGYKIRIHNASSIERDRMVWYWYGSITDMDTDDAIVSAGPLESFESALHSVLANLAKHTDRHAHFISEITGANDTYTRLY